jgi:hypothetical protein
MRFYADDPTKITNVQWYFVPQGREWLGLPTIFGTTVFDELARLTPPPVGEVWGTRVYSKGRPPFPVPTGGLCGTPEQWENGALSTDPLPPLQPGTTIPVCCALLPGPIAAGQALGGNMTSTPLPPITTECSHLNPAALQYSFTLSTVSNTSSCALCTTIFNTTLTVTHTSGCVWELVLPNFCGFFGSFVNLTVTGTNAATLSFPDFVGPVYTSTNFTVFGGTFNFVSITPGSVCAGWPATISVTAP